MFGSKWKILYKNLVDAFCSQGEQLSKARKDLYHAEQEIEHLKCKFSQLHHEWANSPPTVSVSPPEVSSVLPRAVFNSFRDKLPNSYLSDDSSAGAIGYKLGVQHTLYEMDKKLVVN